MTHILSRTLIATGLCLLALACGCSSSGENLATDGPPTVGEDLTTGQEVLNVVTFPFRMLGYAIYYPLKFILYDIWAALFGWLFGGGNDDGSVGALVEDLDDTDPQVRARSAFLLGFEGSKEVADALVPLIADDNEQVRAAAVASLGRIGSPALERDVVAFMTDKRSDVRAAATRALGLLRAEGSLWAVTKALEDESWKVRTEAARALGRIGSWVAGPKVAGALKDPDPRVRGAAAVGLGLMGNEQALPHLRALFMHLEKEGTFVCAAVIVALAKLGAGDLVDPLMLIAEGKGLVKDPHSRSAALWALGKLGLQESRPILEKVLAQGSEPLKVLEGAAIGLGLLAADSALEKASKSDHVMVRAASVTGWLDRGGERAVETLSALAADPYADVRQRAIVALLQLGHRRAVVFLIDQLRSPDPETRAFFYLELLRISGEDHKMDAAKWLEWWERAKSTWELRRYYASPDAER